MYFRNVSRPMKVAPRDSSQITLTHINSRIIGLAIQKTFFEKSQPEVKSQIFLSSSQRLKGELTENTLNGAIFSQISYHFFAVGFLTDQAFTFTIASLTLKLVRGRCRRSWRGRVSSASESQSSVSG